MSGRCPHSATLALLVVGATGCPQSLNAAGIPNYQQDHGSSAQQVSWFKVRDADR